MEMSKSQFNEFRSEFAEAMKALEERFGVSIEMGNIRYDDDYFTSKMTVTNKTVSGYKITEVSVTDAMSDLNAVTIGSRWKKDGGNTIYTVVDYKGNRPKYPWIIESENGARYKCPSNVFGRTFKQVK